VTLADFARDHPDDTHEHTDLAECCGGVPWLGGLPPGFPASTSAGALPGAGASAQRLRQIAATSWPHPPAAYDAAVSLLLVPRADLLAAVEKPPAGVPAAEVWACLGLLHHDAEEPWAGSARRATLHELAARPGRVAEAAMFALVVSAWVDPCARADVAATVAARLFRPGARPFAALALATPGLGAAAKDRATAMIQAARGPRPRQPVRRGRFLLRWRRR
jgi:hypothetical protein